MSLLGFGQYETRPDVQNIFQSVSVFFSTQTMSQDSTTVSVWPHVVTDTRIRLQINQRLHSQVQQDCVECCAAQLRSAFTSAQTRQAPEGTNSGPDLCDLWVVWLIVLKSSFSDLQMSSSPHHCAPTTLSHNENNADLFSNNMFFHCCSCLVSLTEEMWRSRTNFSLNLMHKVSLHNYQKHLWVFVSTWKILSF